MLNNAYGKSDDNEMFLFGESNNSVSINYFWLHSNKKRKHFGWLQFLDILNRYQRSHQKQYFWKKIISFTVSIHMELKTSSDIKTMHITHYAIDFVGPMRFLNTSYILLLKHLSFP